ncbi:hypothetical protein DY000_02062566 [Brassica cretica]|uniref:Uncharacterized protein n=1 Tax=Brassica cretica TaxID=69181 RepID=A0ABQ7ANL2_BRACR|nr:hypothetical protein DY000_02062566 [Brassica cretica]
MKKKKKSSSSSESPLSFCRYRTTSFSTLWLGSLESVIQIYLCQSWLRLASRPHEHSSEDPRSTSTSA